MAVVEPLERELHEALADCGLHFDVPHVPVPEEMDPADLVKLGPAQTLLLDLYEWTQAGPQASPQAAAQSTEPMAERHAASCRELLVRKLKRLHRSVESGLAQFDSLDDPARHRLRKRAKRLRYGVEFGASLFSKRAVRGYLDALKETQDRLGAFVDITVAMQAYKAQDMSDARVLFALGWLAARKKALIADMAKVAADLRKAPRFWKSQ